MVVVVLLVCSCMSLMVWQTYEGTFALRPSAVWRLGTHRLLYVVVHK